MPDGDLWQLAEVEEISIGFTRPDGPTGSTPVWAVQAGEAVFVRSIRGRRGGWYRRLGVNPDGEVGDGAHTHPCAPARSRTPAPWRRSPVPTRPSTVTARMEAAADRGGGRRDAVAGARLSRRWPPGDAHLIPGRTRPAEAVQTQGAGRRSIPSPNGSGQNQDEQAQGDPSEAPGFGDRISPRRQNAELGHQRPAQARPFIAWLGSRRSGQGSTP